MSTAVKFFYAGVLALHIYVLYFLHYGLKFDAAKINNPDLKNTGRFSLRFLTNWTYGLQAFYYALAVLTIIVDAFGARNLKRKLTGINDFIFTSVSTPVALVVTVIFWGIYNVDRELIFPKVLDLVFPSWINHCIHSLNSVFPLIDLYLVKHNKVSWTTSIKGLVAYLLAYAICIFGTYFETGLWIYPILRELSWPMRGVFSIGTFVVSFVMLSLVRGLNNLAWGNSATAKKVKNKKK